MTTDRFSGEDDRGCRLLESGRSRDPTSSSSSSTEVHRTLRDTDLSLERMRREIDRPFRELDRSRREIDRSRRDVDRILLDVDRIFRDVDRILLDVDRNLRGVVERVLLEVDRVLLEHDRPLLDVDLNLLALLDRIRRLGVDRSLKDADRTLLLTETERLRLIPEPGPGDSLRLKDMHLLIVLNASFNCVNLRCEAASAEYFANSFIKQFSH